MSFAPPPPPACHGCSVAAAVRTPDGLLWCHGCLEQENRRNAIANAQEWLVAMFCAVQADQRRALYRSLAAVFHPDAGGDPALMVALNAAREKFP